MKVLKIARVCPEGWPDLLSNVTESGQCMEYIKRSLEITIQNEFFKFLLHIFFGEIAKYVENNVNGYGGKL